MKMNWYYRMILSYAPILFVIISSMIFIFFLLLNHASEKKYIETNQAILDRMVYNIDANLMLIERNVVSRMLTDNLIQDYFSDRQKNAYDYYELQKRLIELSSSLPFSNTIYLYNEADGRVISDMASYSPGSFGDSGFLMASYAKDDAGGWHDPREFALAAMDEQKQKVISLMKLYRTGNETRGALVVNVYEHALLEYLNTLNDNAFASIRLLDADPARSGSMSDAAMIMVQSEYTGWSFVSEGVDDQEYNALSLFSSAWMIILVVIIALALLGFTVVTHLHYKPIQSIVDKVSHYSNRKSEQLGIKGANNEFTFIEMALDHLLKRSLDYESLHKEDSLLRQQRLYHELLAGHLSLSDEEFKMKLVELELPDRYDRLGVIVADIDHYANFIAHYKVKDQHLLKFVLESAFRDLGQNNNAYVWSVWMEPYRIAFVVHHLSSDQRSNKPVIEYAEEFHRWINQNLKLTVTIGVGADSNSIATISDSYRNALDNLALKTVFGTNAIIDNRRSAAKLSLDNYAYLQALDSAAQSFRMNESEWREKLTMIFSRLKQMRIMKPDLSAFVNSCILQMDKATTALSANIQAIWRQDYQQRIADLIDKVETVEELEEQLMSIMTMFEACVDEDRRARRHHSIALQAKSYIDTHYADPSLSLSKVSDYLKLQPSALSQLFKAELGEKFIDYVLKVRMQHAKQLLIDTDDSIQSIAEQIGYLNVISFYRAFKKVQDYPPGEYRNMYRTS
jgi:two-component system, response regulator YesN